MLGSYGSLSTLDIAALISPMDLVTYYVIVLLKSQTVFCGWRPPQLVMVGGHNIMQKHSQCTNSL